MKRVSALNCSRVCPGRRQLASRGTDAGSARASANPIHRGNPIFAVRARRPLPGATSQAPGDVALTPTAMRQDGAPSTSRLAAAVDAYHATTGRELALRSRSTASQRVSVCGGRAANRGQGGRLRSGGVSRARRSSDAHSVQLRSATPPDYPRWRRSVPLDIDMREIELLFDAFTPPPPEARASPDLGSIDTLLFVVDTVNTAPAMAGIVFLDDVRLARVAAVR